MSVPTCHFPQKPLRYWSSQPIVNGIGEAARDDREDWPRYVRITDIATPRALRSDTFKSLPHSVAAGAPLMRNDLLFAAVGASYGKSYLHTSDETACFAGYLVRVRPKPGVDPRFLAYWGESRHFWHQVESQVVQATIQNFSAGKYRRLLVPSPALPTQRAIADFLDRKTAAIDALVEKKQRLLDLLTDKRSALINRAVTKGLDPNVPMKDSGIPWIGEVPAHWTVTRLKFTVSDVVDCHHSTPLYREGAPFPALRTADVSPGYLDVANARRVDEDEFIQRVSRLRPRSQDIIYSREGERFGMAALLPDGVEACLAQRVMLFRAAHDHDPSFLMWTLNADCVYQQMNQYVVGATSPHVNIRDIREAWVPAPPLAEQRAIGAHISDAFQQERLLGSRLEHHIGLLKEYRQALITAAVTGQLDIAEADGEEAA